MSMPDVADYSIWNHLIILASPPRQFWTIGLALYKPMKRYTASRDVCPYYGKN